MMQSLLFEIMNISVFSHSPDRDRRLWVQNPDGLDVGVQLGLAVRVSGTALLPSQTQALHGPKHTWLFYIWRNLTCINICSWIYISMGSFKKILKSDVYMDSAQDLGLSVRVLISRALCPLLAVSVLLGKRSSYQTANSCQHKQSMLTVDLRLCMSGQQWN